MPDQREALRNNGVVDRRAHPPHSMFTSTSTFAPNVQVWFEVSLTFRFQARRWAYRCSGVFDERRWTVCRTDQNTPRARPWAPKTEVSPEVEATKLRHSLVLLAVVVAVVVTVAGGVRRAWSARQKPEPSRGGTGRTSEKSRSAWSFILLLRSPTSRLQAAIGRIGWVFCTDRRSCTQPGRNDKARKGQRGLQDQAHNS